MTVIVHVRVYACLFVWTDHLPYISNERIHKYFTKVERLVGEREREELLPVVVLVHVRDPGLD